MTTMINVYGTIKFLYAVVCLHCSKTVVHPAPRKILESVTDQENVPVTSVDKAPVVESDSASDSVKPNIVSRKRPNAAAGTNAPAKKSSKVAKSAPKPKVVPLQKGQKKLSAFFRM